MPAKASVTGNVMDSQGTKCELPVDNGRTAAVCLYPRVNLQQVEGTVGDWSSPQPERGHMKEKNFIEHTLNYNFA